MTRILFVCTGNTCRSPMAEAVCNHLARQRGIGVYACSAGISAFNGMPISQHACDVLKERGIDASGHRSQVITAQLMETADRIYCMSEGHALRIQALFPGKTASVLCGSGVEDPYGLPLEYYEKTLEQIQRAVEEILDASEKEEELTP